MFQSAHRNMFPRFLHLGGLVMLLALLSVHPVMAANPAFDNLLESFPKLQGGGQTADTFAAWSNACYLLRNAYTLGPILISEPTSHSSTEGVLYFAAGKLVLGYWSDNVEAASVLLKPGKDAKIYGRGHETRSVRGRTLITTSTNLPHFLVNANEGYVAEAAIFTTRIEEDSPATPKKINEELGDMCGASARAAWEQAFNKLDTALIKRSAFDTEASDVNTQPLNRAAVREIGQDLAAFLQQVDRSYLAACRALDFPLALRILKYRLRLQELSCGLAAWQGRLPHSEPLNDAARMKFTADFFHQLAHAEPKTALHGYPVTGGLLRGALALLNDQENSRYYQLRLAYLDTAIPYLRAIEPAAMQNLEIGGRLVYDDLGISLILTLHNCSSEQASGAFRFTLFGHPVTQTYRINASQSISITFPIPANVPPLTHIALEGALTDGTPMPSTTITITQLATTP